MSYQEERLQEIADAIRVQKKTDEKILAKNFASEILSLKTGGDYNIEQTFVDGGCELHITQAGESKKLYYCEAIDYDGTILKSGWYVEGQAFVLPEFPSHDKLVAQEWVSNLPIVDNKIIVTSDVDAGVIYTTQSGLTEFDIVLTSDTGLTVTLNLNGNKNWGDGATDASTSHIYSNYGNYTISCDATEIVSNKAEDSYIGIFDSFVEEGNKSCVAIRLGSNVTRFGDMAWTTSVKYITIPKSVTTLKGNANTDIVCDSYVETLICNGGISEFQGLVRTHKIIMGYGITKCPKVQRCDHINLPDTIQSISQIGYISSNKKITIPSGVSSVGNLQNLNCDELEFKDGVESVGNITDSSIKNIVIPNSVTSIGSMIQVDLVELNLPSSLTEMGDVTECMYLKRLDIPDGVTELAYDFVIGCPSLQEIVFPKNITELPGSLYFGIITLDFSRCVNVVTASDLTIGGLSSVIIVPDDLYSQWIANSNWAPYINLIKKASEV